MENVWCHACRLAQPVSELALVGLGAYLGFLLDLLNLLLDLILVDARFIWAHLDLGIDRPE